MSKLFIYAFSLHNDRMDWIIDTGAFNHMTFHEEWFFNVFDKRTKPRSVHLPNGQTTLVTHTGSCMITHNHCLKDVLLVPNFRYNLLSMSKLIRDMHCTIIFLLGIIIFQALSYGRIMGIGREADILYTCIGMTNELYKHTTAGTSTTFI